MLTFIAKNPATFDHLVPIWLALPGRYKSKFFITKAVLGHSRHVGVICEVATDARIRSHVDLTKSIGVVAYQRDLNLVQENNRCILMEHGTGQRYVDGANEGWNGRLLYPIKVKSIMAPNRYWAEILRKENPGKTVYTIGTPKLDKYINFLPKAEANVPTIAIAFRWDCQVCPESAGTFEYWKGCIRALTVHYKVLGHAHPALWRSGIADFYKSLGIEVVRDFGEVLNRARIFVMDNSSAIFEFAATGRPVVVLNSPQYRRGVNHGLRFWDYADVGVNCDKAEPGLLVEAINKALIDQAPIRKRREEISQELFPYMGCSSTRAAEFLIRSIESHTCRWRGSRITDDTYMCSSSQIVNGANGVNSRICQECILRNHPPTSEDMYNAYNGKVPELQQVTIQPCGGCRGET